jgi:ABC-2 type transport system permease protein
MRVGAATAFAGVARREALRFANQRERFLAALVRPLVWLFIFAAGFRSVLGLSITPPYETYVLYEVYVTPGLCGMILLFSGMQSSLSMVCDRETGAMRALLVSPYPRWFLLGSKLFASVLVSVLQVYAFLVIAWFLGGGGAASGVRDGLAGARPRRGHARLARAADLVGDPPARELHRGDELRHLSDVLRLDRALSAVADAGLEFNPLAFAVVAGPTVVFFGGTIFMYDPAKGLWRGRRGGNP